MEGTVLTNLQLELLKIFSREAPASDLIEIRDILSQFFAKKLIESANQSWKQQNWTEEKANEILHTHIRTPYK